MYIVLYTVVQCSGFSDTIERCFGCGVSGQMARLSYDAHPLCTIQEQTVKLHGARDHRRESLSTQQTTAKSKALIQFVKGLSL